MNLRTNQHCAYHVSDAPLWSEGLFRFLTGVPLPFFERLSLPFSANRNHF